MAGAVRQDMRCEMPRCRSIYEMRYYGKRLCFRCWARFAAFDDDGTALRARLKIERGERGAENG